MTASAEVVNGGRTLYTAYCAVCHGGAAVSGGVIADLRHLNQNKHAAFVGIVQNGLTSKGMPSFAGVLKDDEIKAIQAYVVQRAQDAKQRRAR